MLPVAPRFTVVLRLPRRILQQKGKGVAWANSLFEDNAEYGYGIAMGVARLRERVARLMEED
jgi:pyruvate/2-oxoacid:ferredoxin oxidoreductase beta subunit